MSMFYAPSSYCFRKPHYAAPTKTPAQSKDMTTAANGAIPSPAGDMPFAIVSKKPTVEELKAEIDSLRLELGKMSYKLNEVLGIINSHVVKEARQSAFVASSAPVHGDVKQVKNNDSVYAGFSSDVHYVDSRPKAYSYEQNVPLENSCSAAKHSLYELNTAVETGGNSTSNAAFKGVGGLSGCIAHSFYQAKDLRGYSYAI